MSGARVLIRWALTLLAFLMLAGCAGTLDAVRGTYQAHRGDVLYEDGDYPAALAIFQEAAEMDNSYACYRLYVMHQYGQGTAKDPAKATVMLEKAASLGDETSQVILGSRLLFGKPARRSEGVRLLEAASLEENRYAYEYLALAYQHGLGVKQNSEYAKEYQRLAKAQGGGNLQLAAPSKKAASNAKLELTQAIQRELKAQGYYRGKIDGLYGPMTRDAITRFQKDHGLAVNPEVSSDVLAQVKGK